jgi:DNA-binding ferritin-like protein
MANKSSELILNSSRYMYHLLNISNQIRVYHWKTHIFSRHKASDELYSNLNELIDRFIEALQGRLIIETNDKYFRIPIPLEKIKLIDYNDNNIAELLVSYKIFLEEEMKSISEYSDLANIRDEMLALINNNIYLFTLK